ncbi:MAG TPA: hypothetical protein VLW54_15545 [Candidatus Acidoferrales bacterium]|nr:hypothetical protein [Candidatus Acidoferrales bacterium]
MSRTARNSSVRRITLAVGILLGAALAAASAFAQDYDGKLLQGMKYRLIGPYRGGRSLTAAGVVGQPDTYYFGAVSGGIWKTTNGGLTWAPLFDDKPVSSIGAIAIAESDPNVIYAGTGEACIRGNISYGDGVYKSTDAGKTWTNVGLRDTRHIGRIVVDPRNADVVYVAALGHAYGRNEQRGVFRSTDGGKTWDKVLYVSDKAGAIDIAMARTNPRILFASIWDAWRTPWSMNSGGPDSALYKSTDGGEHWKKVEGNGWPSSTLGRIGVSISGADSNRVYAVVEALEELGGVYRSDDGGEHWTHTTDDHRLRDRSWYYMHIFADTKNPDVVYCLNVGAYKSIDAGKTWNPLSGFPHGDHHGLWIDPTNPKRMIESNDGGATISTDGGISWTREDTQPTAQFYHIVADDLFPYAVYGAQQDNSPVRVPTRSDRGRIGPQDWANIGGGEAGYVAVDQADQHITYAGDYWGILVRGDRRNGEQKDVQVWPDDSDGHEAANLKYRFNWTEPVITSRHDPKKMYYAGNIVFESTDRGQHWTPISPDLTRNDKSKQGRSGGPITEENISVEYYDVVFTLAESPLQAGLLWAGTDDGLVYITHDDGKHWSNVTPREIPDWSMVSLLDASAHDAASAFIAVDRHKFDDFKPYIYKTHDSGKSWTKITDGIPDGSYVHVVREDPRRKGLLFAGTETGIFVSFDDGAHWQSLKLNMPTTPIHDLVIHGHDLDVATHGRSFWVLDDVTPLRDMTQAIAGSSVYLFPPAPALRFRGGRGRRAPNEADNPPSGAILYYYLDSAAKEPIHLEILDARNNVIRRYSSEKAKKEGPPEEGEEFGEEIPPEEVLPDSAGMHRFVWDLRYPMPDVVPKTVWDMGKPGMPLVLPGSYQVRLTAEGKTLTAPLEVKLDPRVSVPRADLEAQLDLWLKARDLLADINRSVLDIRSVRSQLVALHKRLVASRIEKEQAIAPEAESIRKKMDAIEAQLIQVHAKSSEDMCNYPTMLDNKVAWLISSIGSADSAPTAAEEEFYAEKRRESDVQIDAWKKLLHGDIAALNRKIGAESIPAVQLAPPKVADNSDPASTAAARDQ